jgi:Xaa-Pro aminopeptidase
MRALATTLVLLTALPTPGAATLAVQEPPVRYDTDLLPPAFHQSRRDSVLATLPHNAVAIVFSSPERTREGDVSYEYRQSSDLYYLTGTHEPSSVLVLAPGGIQFDGDTVPELLFVPPKDPESETWTGRRFGPERAQRELGVARAAATADFERVVTPLLASGRRVYHLPLPTGIPDDSELARQIAVVGAHVTLLTLDDAATFIAQRLLGTETPEAFERNRAMLRRMNRNWLEGTPLAPAYEAYLDAESFDAWRAWQAEHVDARFAHREAMRSIEPGMHEYEVEALIEYVFKRNGAEYPGFPSIVGSGENSVILHYESNRRQMRAGDMVVMDIGAEYHGYTADVTRTVPVSGRFSPEQRAVYEVVLRAQEAGIRATRAGAPFGAPHQAAMDVVADGLHSLGIIRDRRQVSRFFNHGTSHYLGLQVHDVGTGGPLAAGVVITVEPGVYIPPSADVDAKWWNIGVRIEDDVLVTHDGPRVLSAGAPRSVAEIETLMREPAPPLPSRVPHSNQ